MSTDTCCACSSPAAALVIDGSHRKPVCEQHELMYLRQGYHIKALRR